MNSDEVVSRIVEEIRAAGADFNLDDPFDDPSLVTTAFMDIEWQDANGNSALMLAAAENRVLQCKGILVMAINSGKLWQIIDARNVEGLNCVDMAVRAGSETCAMLITRVAREYAKLRPRDGGKKRDSITTDEDVTFALDGTAAAAAATTTSVELMDESIVKELIRQSATASGHRTTVKPLARDKISNSLNRNVTSSTTSSSSAAAAAGHAYLKMVKRSRSAHSRLMSQRTFSESGDDATDVVVPPPPPPPPDHGVFSTMGERFRSLFGRKPPVHSRSLQQTTSTSSSSSSASHPVATRTTSMVNRHPSYHVVGPTSEEDHIRSHLPQHCSEDSGYSDRPSTGSGRPSSTSGSSARPSALVTTQNGVRLPPLSLRRRGSSEHRNREFSSLGD